MLAGPSSQLGGLAFAAIVLATSTVLVAGLAWVSRRLLGLPVGALRALISGLLGFAAALLLGRSLQAAQPGHAVAFITVVLGVPLIVAMLFIVMAEILVPSGTLPQPLEMVRGTRAAIARSRRYAQISRIAVRHGLGPYLRGRRVRGTDVAGGRAALALSLRQALEEGGVTFTKLGQLLSTRSDLLPPEFTAELAKLQDRAEPAPWEQVAEVIAESLGAPPGEIFAELRPEPAAAASIAQVHKARLRRGTAPDAVVAVKVQRPGIRASVEQDLDIQLRLADRLEDRARWAGARSVQPASPAGSPRPSGKSWTSGVEARNMAAVAATWPEQQRAVGREVSVVMPTINEQLCTEHVLVIEWLDGVNLRAAGQQIDERGLDRALLARALLRSMVYQITEGRGVPRRPASGQHPAARRRSPRPARLRLGRPPRCPAADRAAEPAAARRRARRLPRRNSAMPCSIWWTATKSLTNTNWNAALGSSSRATSPAAPGRPLTCSPTCSAWPPGLS